jgi:uncharacterized protein
MNKPSISTRLVLRQIPDNAIIVMKQKWRNLLFLHWEFDPEEIQLTLPSGLYVDTFNEKAYVGITPFFLFDVRPVFLPAISLLSDFLEVNVRTYVHDEKGIPGVWFYSLDANQPIAVKLAQQINLPYKKSEIKAEKNKDSQEIFYKVKRKNGSDNLSSEFIYKPDGKEFYAESGSLEFFLVERYLLFSYNNKNKKLNSIQVHHQPYPLNETKLSKWDDNLLKLNGLKSREKPPDHIITSPGVDVDIYNIKSNR